MKMIKRNLTKILIAFTMAIAIVAMAVPAHAEKTKTQAIILPVKSLQQIKLDEPMSAVEILENKHYIAHAMGLASNQKRTDEPLNCLEGFETSYANGTRIFEVDFSFTRDGELVLRHDWWHDWQENISWVDIPDESNFKSTKYYGKYTPLTWKDLLSLLDQYPDIAVITDTKFDDSSIFYMQFDKMLQDTRDLNLMHVWDRIIVQCYNSNMHTALSKQYPEIKHYIYTMYMDGWFDQKSDTFEAKCKQWSEKGALAITMEQSVWHKEFKPIADKYNLKILVHTVNNFNKAKTLFSEGCHAIYTDFLCE